MFRYIVMKPQLTFVIKRNVCETEDTESGKHVKNSQALKHCMKILALKFPIPQYKTNILALAMEHVNAGQETVYPMIHRIQIPLPSKKGSKHFWLVECPLF